MRLEGRQDVDGLVSRLSYIASTLYALRGTYIPGQERIVLSNIVVRAAVVALSSERLWFHGTPLSETLTSTC